MSSLLYTGFLKDGSVIILVEDTSTYVISQIDQHGTKKALEVLSKNWHNNISAKEFAINEVERMENNIGE